MERISIDKCREILGEKAEFLSDAQIEGARDALYVLGESVLDNIFDSGNVVGAYE